MSKQLLLGDEAIAQAALDAGLSGVYAYPGTPSTEITEYIQTAAITTEKGIHNRWCSNEKTAMEAALGQPLGKALPTDPQDLTARRQQRQALSYSGRNACLIHPFAQGLAQPPPRRPEQVSRLTGAQRKISSTMSSSSGISSVRRI